MKKYLVPIAIFTAAMTFQSCKTNNKAQTSPVFVGDNSATSLDWAGTYTGTLPCADCEGIFTTLILNADLTYEQTNLYLGKSTDKFRDKGKFTWNDLGSIVTLEGVLDHPAKFQVAENRLIQLDMQGKPITGDLADKYILEKQVSDLTDVGLTGKRWKLVELNGAPVKDTDQDSPAFIEFQKGESKVNGFAGCNNFFGNYELEKGNRISFSGMASTMMACPDLNHERELLNVFETADNYTIYGNELSLNKARMAPLAKFILMVDLH